MVPLPPGPPPTGGYRQKTKVKVLWKAKQYLGAISQEHIAAFGLDNACAVVLDDCAERRTGDPADKDVPVHSALHRRVTLVRPALGPARWAS